MFSERGWSGEDEISLLMESEKDLSSFFILLKLSY